MDMLDESGASAMRDRQQAPSEGLYRRMRDLVPLNEGFLTDVPFRQKGAAAEDRAQRCRPQVTAARCAKSAARSGPHKKNAVLAGLR